MQAVRFADPNHSRSQNLPLHVCRATDRYTTSSGHSTAMSHMRGLSDCFALSDRLFATLNRLRCIDLLATKLPIQRNRGNPKRSN